MVPGITHGGTPRVGHGEVRVELDVRWAAGLVAGQRVPGVHHDRIEQVRALGAVGLALDGVVGAGAAGSAGTPRTQVISSMTLVESQP